MHAWNFSQTFAHMWIGEQSFRCIDPTHARRISTHNQLIQVSVSLQPPVYARRQIIPIAVPHHLNKYACQLTYLYIERKAKERDKRPDIDSFLILLLTTLYRYLDARTHLYLFWEIFSPPARPYWNGKERKHTITNLDQNIYRWRWKIFLTYKQNECVISSDSTWDISSTHLIVLSYKTKSIE